MTLLPRPSTDPSKCDPSRATLFAKGGASAGGEVLGSIDVVGEEAFKPAA